MRSPPTETNGAAKASRYTEREGPPKHPSGVYVPRDGLAWQARHCMPCGCCGCALCAVCQVDGCTVCQVDSADVRTRIPLIWPSSAPENFFTWKVTARHQYRHPVSMSTCAARSCSMAPVLMGGRKRFSHHLLVSEKYKGGNGCDLILLRECLILVHVELAEDDVGVPGGVVRARE